MNRLIAVLLLVSFSAFAQTEPAPKPKPAPAPKTQTVTFGDGDFIDGVRLVPLDEIYLTLPKAHFANLIKVRTNFNDKLLQSVNEL